jgi:hypothetical protein
MNTKNPFDSGYSRQIQKDLAQERFALAVCGRLSDSAQTLPRDVSERLRAARAQAVSKRKVASFQTATASAVSMSGGAATLTFGDDPFGLWNRIAAFFPLIVLVFGLITISMIQNENRASEVAEIDAALLTDDLPPAAYADPGFAQFLKSQISPTQ